LLDANLHGQPVSDIASALTRQRIPFVFITGYGRESLPVSFRQAPALDKPVGDKELIETIRKLLSGKGRPIAEVVTVPRPASGQI
jgi:FixJ family two-component response regulator